MGKDPLSQNPRGRSGSQDPSVAMNRNVTGQENDPFRERRHLPDDTVCSRCDAVYSAQRWTINPSRKALVLSADAGKEVLCPACAHVADHLPEGILTLRGDFWQSHLDEVLGLIGNEADAAEGDNATSRVMSIRRDGGDLILETTNEKLAQRIGRRLEHAYGGSLAYQWGHGNQLVRVDWSRDA